jgi:hypothetical protein
MIDDTIIAPSTDGGGDPISDYRKYLERNTGDRAQPSGEGPADIPPAAGPPPDSGAGPQIAPSGGPDPDAPPPAAAGPGEAEQAATSLPAGQGAGPSIAPVAGQAAPQSLPSGGMGGGGQPMDATPTLDMIAPNPLGAPQAPQADQAPQAPQAKKAAKAKGAAQATQAPTIEGRASPAAGTDLGDESKMTPASGHVAPGKKTADGRPLLNVQPPGHDPADFDTDKLSNAHTVADVFDALPPKKQTQYMDWWQQQHGDINQRYDQMRQDLGSRPDPNRDPTKKEKFTELMNFGLNLMQNAKRGNDPFAAMGASMQEAMGTQKAKQRQDTADYDARAAGIEGQRQSQLKDIGNYGNAVREDATINLDRTRQAIAVANANKPPRPAPQRSAERSYDKSGNMTVRDDDPTSPTFGKWLPASGADGKPLGPQNIAGPRGGAAAGGSKQIEAISALEARGYKTADAVNIVMHVKPSGDPFHDYQSILNKNTPSGASADEVENARQIAEDTVNHMYGQGALQGARDRRQNTISGPVKAPPVAPPIGKIGTDADGRKWKNDGNGRAVPAT